MKKANVLQLGFVTPLKNGRFRTYGAKVSYELNGNLEIVKEESSDTQTGAVEFWTKQCCRVKDANMASVAGMICVCGAQSMCQVCETDCDVLFSFDDQLYGQNSKERQVYSISASGKHKAVNVLLDKEPLVGRIQVSSNGVFLFTMQHEQTVIYQLSHVNKKLTANLVGYHFTIALGTYFVSDSGAHNFATGVSYTCAPGLIKRLPEVLELFEGVFIFSAAFCGQCTPKINYNEQKKCAAFADLVPEKVPLAFRNLIRPNISEPGTFFSTAMGVTYHHDKDFNVINVFKSKCKEDKDPLVVARSYDTEDGLLGYANCILYDVSKAEPAVIDNSLERNDDEMHLIWQSNGIFAYEAATKMIYELRRGSFRKPRKYLAISRIICVAKDINFAYLAARPGYSEGWYSIYLIPSSDNTFEANLQFMGNFRMYDNAMLGYTDGVIHDLTTAQTHACAFNLVQIKDAKNHFEQLRPDGSMDVRECFIQHYLIADDFYHEDFVKRRSQIISGALEIPFIVPQACRHFLRPHPYRDTYLCNGHGFQFECTKQFICKMRVKSEIFDVKQSYTLETIVRDAEYWYCVLDNKLYQVRVEKDSQPEMLVKLTFMTHPSCLMVLQNQLYIVPSTESTLYRLDGDNVVPLRSFPQPQSGLFQLFGRIFLQANIRTRYYLFEARYDGTPIEVNIKQRTILDADEIQTRYFHDEQVAEQLMVEEGVGGAKIIPFNGFTWTLLESFANPIMSASFGFTAQLDFYYDVISQTTKRQFAREEDNAGILEWSVRAAPWGASPSFKDFAMFSEVAQMVEEDWLVNAYQFYANFEPQTSLTMCERALVNWGDKVAGFQGRLEQYEEDREKWRQYMESNSSNMQKQQQQEKKAFGAQAAAQKARKGNEESEEDEVAQKGKKKRGK